MSRSVAAGAIRLSSLLSRRFRGARNQATAIIGAAASTIEALEDRRLFTTYYCNANVASNGTGTAASPWNRLQYISAYTGFHSGDVVQLTGTFTNQTLSLQSTAAGVTITSNPTAPAKIAESSAYGFVSAITVSAAGVTLSNLILTGPGTTADNNSYYGIWFENTGSTQLVGATVNHCNVTGFVFAGLELDGNNTVGFTNANISNSTFSDNQVSGIVVTGNKSSYVNVNMTIYNCVTSGNAGAAIWYNANTANANENSSNGGIYVSSLNGAVISHCTAIDNCYNSTGACGIWCWTSEYVDIEYCEAAGTKTVDGSWDGCGFDLDKNTSYSIMQYDYSHDNEGQGFFICTYDATAACTADTIRYCISDDDGYGDRGGIELYNDGAHPIVGANIYDNTIMSISDSTGAIVIDGATVGEEACTANFMNNIVYDVYDVLINCASFTPSLSNLKFEGNEYYSYGEPTDFKVFWGQSTYTTLSSFRSGTGEETINGSPVGINADPMAHSESVSGLPVSDLPITDIADYMVPSNSPAVGAALNLAAAPFSNSAPYNEYAPYNVGGTGWGGLGKQDYYGFSVNDGGSLNIGANGSNRINIASGTMSLPIVPATTVSTTTLSSVIISANTDVLLSGAESNHSTRTLAVVTAGLTIAGSTNAWTGTLDLGDNDLKIQNGNLATLTNQVRQGYNNNWLDDGGITSSAAAADSTHLTALGVIQNSTTGSSSGPVLYSTFDTSTSLNTDVLVKYTYYGDATLNGKVDGTDYARIDNGYLGKLTGWYNGDFNYDGIINGSDYTLIDNAFNTQGASLAAEIAPTPTATIPFAVKAITIAGADDSISTVTANVKHQSKPNAWDALSSVALLAPKSHPPSIAPADRPIAAMRISWQSAFHHSTHSNKADAILSGQPVTGLPCSEGNR